MKQVVTKGATSQTVYVFIRDSSATTGVGLTGLAYNSGSLVASYVRPLGSRTAITLATQTVTGAWSSGGFVEVDATNMPGIYRLDVPDAVFASGVNSAIVMLKGATNMEPCSIEFQLLGVNFQDAVRAGMTALPNAAAEAAGGLFTRGTGAGQINQDANGRIDANVAALSTDSGAADNAEAFFDGTGYAGTNNVIPTVTTTTNLTNAPTNGDLTATMKASVNAEVVDGLGVDTITEQAQGNPPAAPTMRQMLSYLYMAWIRNRKTVDASSSPAVESVLANDDTTVVFKRNISDSSNITTFAKSVTG